MESGKKQKQTDLPGINEMFPFFELIRSVNWILDCLGNAKKKDFELQSLKFDKEVMNRL